jgi:hypothetical protein
MRTMYFEAPVLLKRGDNLAEVQFIFNVHRLNIHYGGMAGSDQ